MFLSILAAALHGFAYIIYLHQVYGGGSIPNPASWTIWAFLSTINALTFWRGSRDPLATAQFFTGSVACVTVWIFALSAGKFAPFDTMAWIVLLLCIAACAVWRVTNNAIYANLVVAGIVLVSAVPTVIGVWKDTGVEQALPWYLWTGAYVITSINVFRRAERARPQWQLLMVMPIVGIVIHVVVAIGASL